MSATYPGYYPGILIQPAVAWFNTPVTKSSSVAPTPGTADPVSMGEFGIISIMEPMTIDHAHLHQIKDGGSGTTTLELFRQRDGVREKVGGVSLAHGAGDFARHEFTVSDKLLEEGDLLYLQATSVMTAAHHPRGFVDVHFVALRK